MLNKLEAYEEAGRRCAIARNEGDEARAMFERSYLARMCAFEAPEDSRHARAAFHLAYALARKI
jgi:hypothetical protein